ncbi:hypothetical protein CVT24_012263 [Panaeolus cyanescens]|uniref:F-box domain-containing protein n=1 Tax=Panaeolus cyanescens TaxID=181874 RepID=A0A409W5T4_9AGAR|nr:hypothetical protein CVT24_012263 [Panaeolus cyanescens]
MPSQDPIFPFEVFGRIIEVIADTPLTNGPLMLDPIATIKQCSLVCRAFMHMTRPYIFRRAELSFRKAKEAHLQRLLQIFEAEPDRRNHIRELHLNFEQYLGQPAPLLELERYNDLLLHSPNIQDVTLFYSSSMYEFFMAPDHITSFCNRILEAYSIKGTLRSLTAKKIDGLPYDILFASDSFQRLSLDRCNWPKVLTPVTHLTVLRLRKIYTLPINILQYFPNLEELSLTSMSFNTDPENNDYPETTLRPCLGLTALSLSTHTDEYGKLCSYLRQHGEKYDQGPFDMLRNVQVDIVYPIVDDMIAVSDLFLSMSSLRHISITMELSRARDRLSLQEYQIDEHIAALPMLQSLNLVFKMFPWNSSYAPTVESLASMFLSPNPHSPLRHFELHLYVEPLGRRQVIEPWSHLSLWCYNCLCFPNFEKLTLKLTHIIEDDAQEESDRLRLHVGEMQAAINSKSNLKRPGPSLLTTIIHEFTDASKPCPNPIRTSQAKRQDIDKLKASKHEREPWKFCAA